MIVISLQYDDVRLFIKTGKIVNQERHYNEIYRKQVY
jgi:hypothetical protein